MGPNSTRISVLGKLRNVLHLLDTTQSASTIRKVQLSWISLWLPNWYHQSHTTIRILTSIRNKRSQDSTQPKLVAIAWLIKQLRGVKRHQVLVITMLHSLIRDTNRPLLVSAVDGNEQCLKDFSVCLLLLIYCCKFFTLCTEKNFLNEIKISFIKVWPLTYSFCSNWLRIFD